MEAAAIGDGSSSTTLPNTNTLSIVSQFHRSAVTRAESGANANTKMDTPHGVEDKFPALQLRGLPPVLKMSKQKYGRRQNSVTRAESHKNADAKMDPAPGVEGNIPDLQFLCRCLELKKSKPKQSCKLNGKCKTCRCKPRK